MSGTVILTVVRMRAYTGSAGSFKVLVDGQVVGKVKNGGTLQVQVDPGRRVIEIDAGAWVGTYRSKALILDCVRSEQIHLQCRARVNGIDLEVIARNGPTTHEPAGIPAPRPTESPASAESHVFVSYSRTDQEYVWELVQHLTGSGLPVWYDRAIRPGDTITRDIERSIHECFAFVVVLTPSAVDSEWVINELGRAARYHKPIRPLMLAPCDRPIQLENTQIEPVTDGRMPSAGFVEDLLALRRAAAV